jgi:hypothetical protein
LWAAKQSLKSIAQLVKHCRESKFPCSADRSPNIEETAIAFVGGGQMATALIEGLLRFGRHANSILVVEPVGQ